jgi:poly(3-hydroxybutyrate) depolymerase
MAHCNRDKNTTKREANVKIAQITTVTILVMTITGHAMIPDSQAIKTLLPESQHAAADFLWENMPESDKTHLTPAFIAQHIDYAYRAKMAFPWAEAVPTAMFLNNVLPYANLNEQRDAWRKTFFERFSTIVANCKTAGEAAIKLNTSIYDALNVHYSKQRSKACMSPFESMAEGKASCTGLSILLVNACRAVGIPARVVGTPLWVEGGGNHTWVEIWDGKWHAIGASESKALDKTWFAKRATKQIADNPIHAIYAVSFKRTDIHFPLVWAMRDKSVRAINVTKRYRANDTELAPMQTIDDFLKSGSLQDSLKKLKKNDLRFSLRDFQAVHQQVWAQYVTEITASEQRRTEQKEKSITYDGATMRYAYKVVGKKPANGYPLYIALHGGGGAPARVNDSQWEHMKVYYLNGVTNGIYLAPRGVNNEWNLHWRKQSFACYDRIIENMIAFGQIDPNRVYIMGFSAGGDATYQIPARMPDRWAGAAMSAGHPNGVSPDNYANLAFLIQVGDRDSAYKRNQVAAEYGIKLNKLAQAHPGLYPHATYIHARRGHNFMDRGDLGTQQTVFTDPAVWLEKGDEAPTEAVDFNSIRWLDQHSRHPYPATIIWNGKTSAERRGNKQPGFWPTAEKQNLHYWIGIDRYDKDAPLEAERVEVMLDKDTQSIAVRQIGNFVRFYLHPDMLDLDKSVTVKVEGKILRAKPTLSLRVLVQSLLDRGDPNYMFPACLTLWKNPEGNWMLE